MGGMRIAIGIGVGLLVGYLIWGTVVPVDRAYEREQQIDRLKGFQEFGAAGHSDWHPRSSFRVRDYARSFNKYFTGRNDWYLAS